MSAYCPVQKEESFAVGFMKNCWPVLLLVPVTLYGGMLAASYIAIATGATGELNPVLHAPLIWMLGR